MSHQTVKRKLAAIFSADVKGYSRLMGEDEEGTLQTLNAYKGAMNGLILEYRGRVVGTAGDSVLAEFGSVIDAVRCAVEIQKEIRARNIDLPEERKMEFRIGVNSGDVIEDGDTIYGDGVNIAARIQSLAEGGGICISGIVYEQVEKRLRLRYEYTGEQTVKNIDKPIRIYRVAEEGWKLAEGKGKAEGRRRRFLIAGIGVVFVAAGILVFWQYVLRTPSPKIEVASKEKMAFPLPDKPSIAVLPFVNMSKDPDQEYFSDGMTEDLITDLSKISGLLVIARNSTFTYKGKPVKVKQVAEELGVRYILEGSVRRAGDEIRINAQLIDAITGHHLWAERYDGTMGKIFALQDQITQKIVSALAVKLTGSEKELVGQKGTKNIEAYDAFLKGYVHYLRFTPEDSGKAVVSLRKAIEVDPKFERAYAVLSAVYYDATVMPALLKGLGVNWFEARLQSLQYLQKATKGPITHYVKSRVYVMKRQHQEAISELEQGLALDPNDPACHQNMGLVLTMAGRPKEAIEYLNRGMRLDPHNPSRYLVDLGQAHFFMGELEEAVGLVEKAMRLNPENAPSWAGRLGAYYALLGRDQEAQASLENLKKRWVGMGPFNLRRLMYPFPFKERVIADRFAEGIIKAGLSAKLTDYLPGFKENQLTGEEIRELFFGSKTAGVFGWVGEWWLDCKKNGDFNYRGPAPISSDIGKARIEGNTMCMQFKKNFGGMEFCMTVFRNPGGTYEDKDEYFMYCDLGWIIFSLVK